MNETMYDEESLLPLSGIQHFAFCRRQWALIHIELQWSENLRTAEGRQLHERVHSLPAVESRGEIILVRSLPLVSHRLGLYGVADLVEFHSDEEDYSNGVTLPGRTELWHPRPVEYKRGRPKHDDRDEVQLCAQAMCLEEMLNVQVRMGAIFYGKTRHRVNIPFSSELRKRVVDLSIQMHETYEAGVTPAAPVNVRCQLCSLKDICLPKVTRKRKPVAKYIRSHIDLQ